MNYLVITDDNIRYFTTATDAARSVRPAWDTETLRAAIQELEPGDELDIDSSTSVIVLSGRNPKL